MPGRYLLSQIIIKSFLQFNECILLFSDMPAVDIDNVVSTSMEVKMLHFTLLIVSKEYALFQPEI